jgi:tetratricopeptide (TPR) repeat protein
MTATNSLKTANQLLQAGKLDDARKEYQTLIQLRPNFPWNYYYLGQLLAQEGKRPDAIANYKRAIELNPNSACFHNSLAEALIEQGELDEAINCSKNAISLQPYWAIYHQILALAYEAKSDFEQAFKTWQKILSLNPSHLRAIHKISWLQTDVARDCAESGDKLNKERKIEEAVEFYQQALILNPQQPMPIYRNCGNNLITLGKFEEAETVFQRLIEVHPKLPDGYHGYARVTHYFPDWELALKRWEEAIVKFPENINFQVSKGNVLINLSRFDEAEAVFQQLIEKYPNQPQGYSAYATVAHHLADWELALKRWLEAIVKFPENINFQVTKGNVLINLSRFDEAEAVFQQLIEKSPNQPQGYDGYARVTHSLADWELALKRWSEAIVKFPENIGFQVQKGNVLINLSRFDEAEAVFQQLIEKSPNQPQGYDGYARVAQSLRDWDLALERWEEAVSQLPYNINFQVQKGNALIKLSQFDEAEAVFKEMMERYPRNYHGYDGYGRVANTLPDWELALERWEDAIAKLPHYFNFYLQKGDVLANLFRYEEAETWWKKVIAKYPHRHEGLSRSAALARRLGNREFAWQRFEQIIEKFPWHLPAYCEAAKESIAMGRFAEAEEKFLLALQRNPNHLTVLLQAGILASQQGSRELALERFERAIEFYHPQKAIDAYILAAAELKYLGRESEAEAKYEQILSFHQQRSLYPEVKLLGTGLTSIQELGLLLDRLVTKQLDSVKDVVSLAKLTDKVLFALGRYPAPVDKDAPSLLPKLRILRELFGQFLATPDDCQEWDLGVADFGYDLYLLAVAKLLNDKFLRLFVFYFHTLIRQWEQCLLVLKHFNMAIQLLEKESQRLNSSEWGRVKLVRTEIPLPLIDKLCFEDLSSSARYVIGTDERVPQSEIEATVKYLPGLMDEEKEYFAASVRKFASSLKLRSRQTIDIFKDFICEPPYGVSEGYIFNGYEKRISEEFVKELIDEGTSSSIEHIAPDEYMRKMGDTRVTLEEIAIKKAALDSYYEDDVVFGLPVVGNIWGAYQNYGHVLFDQVPSLILYQKLNLSCKIFVPHITHLHWEMFGHLNIPKEKILVRQEQRFKYFVISRFRGFHSKETNNFYRNLRKSIVAKRGDIPSEYRARYVYISRRYSNRRKMANEVEVEELMASLGFLIVYTERLSFEEQAVLMDRACFVVVPYGTSVLNSCMCHPNTTIVLITPPGAPLGQYQFRICSLAEHNLYMLLGNKRANGWEMNIDKLKKVVSTILENS